MIKKLLRRDVDMLDKVQQRATKTVKGLEDGRTGAPLLQGKAERWDCSAWEEEAQGDLINLSKCLQGGCKEALFSGFTWQGFGSRGP